MTSDIARIYQRVGEFVVMYQWVEHQFRQIGWYILDPERRHWPPPGLRTEASGVLADRVLVLYEGALPKMAMPPDHTAAVLAEFRDAVERFHRLRRARNSILHSAYIELKAGGDVQAVLRADPKFYQDPETDEPVLHQEVLSTESCDYLIEELGRIGFALGIRYREVLARYNDDRVPLC